MTSKETASKAQESKTKRPSRPPAGTLAATRGLGLAEVRRSLADPLTASPQQIAQLQGRYGNRAVQRLIQRAQAQREAPVELEGGEVSGNLQSQIDSARGGGQLLDKNAGSQIGGALGADLSHVRVHTDAKADTLNRSLNARAFTHGSDVFFSQGAYNPATPRGKHLLAHELTHVVQQGGVVGATKDNKIQPMKAGPAQRAGAALLRRLPGDLIQRDIDRAGFESRLKQERAFGNAYKELIASNHYLKLLGQIDKYNQNQNQRRLKSVKRALGQLESTLQKNFIDAYEHLMDDIRNEEAVLLNPKRTPSPVQKTRTQGDLPPLREPPKSGDRPFTGLDVDEEPEEKQPQFLRILPPLREPPKAGDRQFMPDEDDDEPKFGEKELPAHRPPFEVPSWRQPLPSLLSQGDKSSSEEESTVPYEEAVSATFSDDTGKIFRKLWRTAPFKEKERIRSLFSVRKKHANLSGLEYVLEALDSQHRLEHRGGLDEAARKWAKDPTEIYFFDWLPQQKGSGFGAKMGQVDYFDEKQRQNYKLKVGSAITYEKSKQPLTGDNIYALSQSNDFYASDRGVSDNGVVHHSSFMSGQAVKAAGHLEFGSPGKLKTINLSSGHYKPKPQHMKNALKLLDRQGVDLTTVIAQPDMHTDEVMNAKLWLEKYAKASKW